MAVITLTARQREIVKLLQAGFTYAEIGTRLAISDATVRVHVALIAKKCPGDSRASPMRRVLANVGVLLQT